MRLEKAELRPYVFQALKKHGSSQYGNICHHVGEACSEFVAPRDGGRVVEIIWELLVQGILAPGSGGCTVQSASFFHVTEYGRQCLEQGEVLPHDPDGYMKRLRERVGQDLDDVVATYVRESLLTFAARRHLAAAVMLGVASERCVDLLAQAVGAHLQSDEAAKFNQRIRKSGRSVKQRFDVLRERLLALELPPSLLDALDIHLSGIFTLIRYTRNEAGHPSGRDVDRETAKANLELFPGYCERVYGLLSHLGGGQQVAEEA